MVLYPRSKWHILTVKVDNEFKKMLELMAKKYGVSVSTIIRFSVAHVIEEHLLLRDEYVECQLMRSDNVIEYSDIMNIIRYQCLDD